MNALYQVSAFPIPGYPSQPCWLKLNQIDAISLKEREVQRDEASVFTSLSTFMKGQDLEDVATDPTLFAGDCASKPLIFRTAQSY